MCFEGGKPSIEVPSGEDFFNQHEHDNPEGFFDSLPDHPTPPADYTPSGMSAGGLDPNRRASSLGGAAANGITGEPSTPMAMDPNHIPEGAERVSRACVRRGAHAGQRGLQRWLGCDSLDG